MNHTKVQLQINIPADWLVTGQTDKFIEVHARVLTLTRAVIYEKFITNGLTMFAFNNFMCDKILRTIDEMCLNEVDRICKSMQDDEIMYHEIAEYGI